MCQSPPSLIAISFLFISASSAIAADSRPISLQKTDPQFQEFISSLEIATRKKDSTAVYALLAPDYYIARDFGGSFNPSASAVKNFSANFEFNDANLRPEYRDYGWKEFKSAIAGKSFEKKSGGELCTPHGALDRKPAPHSQICFRKSTGGWRIQGHINGGD